MTVHELIEDLRRLPGDPDLRAVVVRVTVQRPNGVAERIVDCAVDAIRLNHSMVVIDVNGYGED